MTTISHEPLERVVENRRWYELLPREMWASLAISVMWVAVVVTAVWGPDIVNTTVGGTSSSVPAAIIVALFAFLATWVVARHGLDHRSGT
jgi:uncharacterized membrane protein (DUF485 family)